MKNLNRTMLVSFMLVVSMILSVSAVFADEGSILLTGGPITFTPDADNFTFGAATLNGSSFHSTDISGNNTTWRMVDARGTGVGWNIKVATGDITGLTRALTLGDTVTPDSDHFGLTVSISPSDVSIMPGAEGSTPASGLTYPTQPSYSLFATTGELTVLTAGTGQGMGGYDIDPYFTLYMPAGTYEGTATLTITVTKTDSAV